MNIIHVSKTALAAAPYEICKCLNNYTDLKVRWIAHRTQYRDGRKFPSDIIFNTEDKQIQNLVAEADIIHFHNEINLLPEEWIRKKKIIIQLHSVPQRMPLDWYARITPYVYCISQPLQMRQYPKLMTLPNLINPEEYTPLLKKNEKPIIAFAPTNSLPVNQIGTKGKPEVCEILSKFTDKAIVKVFSNFSYEDNLLEKRNSDILVDDVINNTFHRTSLEGSCFGLAVINNFFHPAWVYADLNVLDTVLDNLLVNTDKLREYQQKSREWILQNWHPKNLVQFYINAYNKILGKK